MVDFVNSHKSTNLHFLKPIRRNILNPYCKVRKCHKIDKKLIKKNICWFPYERKLAQTEDIDNDCTTLSNSEIKVSQITNFTRQASKFC